MIQRHLSTSLRGPPRHVGGPDLTGLCVSSCCFWVRHWWLPNSCLSRTSWSMKTSNEPFFCGTVLAPSSRGSASGLLISGKVAGPLCWRNSSGIPAADGCWPGEATSRKSLTKWCWNSSLRGCQKKKTAQWVQCHRPTSLDLAIQLTEDQMVACPGISESLPSVSLSLSLSLSLWGYIE